MCRKLRLASRPTNSMDPLLFLPLELVQTILEYLAFVDLMYVPFCDLLPIFDVDCICSNCLGVSKGWNEYLSSMPYLWTNLDLSASKRPVRVSSIKACIRRSQRGITRATLNGLMTLQGGILKLITANCPNLEHLEICQGFVSASLLEAAPLAHSLNTLILSRQCEVTVETIMYLLGICRTISRAEFHTISEFVHHAAQWPLDLKSLRQLRLGTHNPHVCSNWRSVAYLVGDDSRTPLHQVMIVNNLVSIVLRHVSFPGRCPLQSLVVQLEHSIKGGPIGLCEIHRALRHHTTGKHPGFVSGFAAQHSSPEPESH